jgi:hypothetical protein
VPGLLADERKARCRGLRLVARLLAGQRAAKLGEALRAAETAPGRLADALAALLALDPLDRRKILATACA